MQARNHSYNNHNGCCSSRNSSHNASLRADHPSHTDSCTCNRDSYTSFYDNYSSYSHLCPQRSPVRQQAGAGHTWLRLATMNNLNSHSPSHSWLHCATLTLT